MIQCSGCISLQSNLPSVNVWPLSVAGEKSDSALKNDMDKEEWEFDLCHFVLSFGIWERFGMPTKKLEQMEWI